MAPKIWTKLFTKQTQNVSKLTTNTASDYLINNKTEDKCDKSEEIINCNNETNCVIINGKPIDNIKSEAKRQPTEDQSSDYLENDLTNKMTNMSCSPSTASISSSSSVRSPTKSLKTSNGESNDWPKIGVLLFNSCGQCGYHYLPSNLVKKLNSLMSWTDMTNKNGKIVNKNNCNDSNVNRFETNICEMIFGSVALNLCSKNSSKMHKLSDDLLMTSFIFQIDFSNGKSFQRKYGLAVIWDMNECDGQLRQLILNESLITDSLITELKNDLINSRLKTPKLIHTSVLHFFKKINDYLSVCRLTTSISDEQFIDELTNLINNYDTKATNFFISTLLTSVLMFKYKSEKMKLILWSNDINKISLISQLLVVINKFLTHKANNNSPIQPQLKSIKFCRNLALFKKTSSVTPISRNRVSERKSRDESLGYESLTESNGSTTTSTICEFNTKSLITSTPLEQSIEGIDEEIIENQTTSQLIQSRNYFREYRNLRFTSNQSNDCIQEESDYKPIIPVDNSDKMILIENLSESQKNDNYLNNNDITYDTTADVEEVCESQLISGFGDCSMPELIYDSNQTSNQISLSQSPTITNTYLKFISIQGIINSKAIDSYEQLVSQCLEQSGVDSNDDTIIVSDCDLWRIKCIESSRCLPAIMSSIVGNLCETIAELYSLKMKSQFILKHIDNKLNQLFLKSFLLKSLIQNSYSESNNKLIATKLLDRNSNQPLFSLIADNQLTELSSIECSSLGFDYSDIPVIIALNRYKTKNNFCKNIKLCESKTTRSMETIL